MARKDLTALAALGTLGYMLSKNGDKKGSVTERQITADREASDQKTSGDQEDMIIEPGSGPHGQKFEDELPAASAPSVTSTKPAAVKPAAVKPAAVKPRDTAKTDETSNLLARYAKPALRQETMKERAESYNAKRFAQKEEDKAAVKDFFGNADKRYLQSKLDRGETLSPMEKAQAKRAGMEGFKRGGKVKKMASGGMASSASKRADGIATKGKTKCKMY